MSSNVLILTGAGINCDYETQWAFQQAGATTVRVPVTDLVAGTASLADFDTLVVPGGFSFGDDLGSGKVLALTLRHHLGDALRNFVAGGGLVLGICNGFQVLVNLGLLPGLGDLFEVQAALTFNESGRFEDRWCHLGIDPESPCVFTAGIAGLHLPVRHGEGRLVIRDPELLDRLTENHQIVARYVGADGRPATTYPDNPNGSLEAIAGLCDPTGRIFGLMPHPEAAVLTTQHPQWTRGELPGLPARELFANAVRAAQTTAPA
jgi:phosphoribosylformylglycinamidine synthase